MLASLPKNKLLLFILFAVFLTFFGSGCNQEEISINSSHSNNLGGEQYTLGSDYFSDRNIRNNETFVNIPETNGIIVDNIILEMDDQENPVLEILYKEVILETEMDIGKFNYSINYAYVDLDADGENEIVSYISSLVFSQSGNYYLDIFKKDSQGNYYIIGKLYHSIKNSDNPSDIYELTILDCYMNGYLVFVSTNSKGPDHYYVFSEGGYVEVPINNP